MPQEEDSQETKVVITYIECTAGLGEALSWMDARQLQWYFDPMKGDSGPENLYLDFQRYRRDWDEVDWEVVAEAIQNLVEVSPPS